MSTGIPKTIIITSMPGRNSPSIGGYAKNSVVSLLSSKPNIQSHMESRKNMDFTTTFISDSCEIKPPVRKRQRLDHLSHEEKIMRRKVKNRVAAQSARDRKKAQMNELEGLAKDLSCEKDQVMAENEKLKKRNLQLEQENLELKRRLGTIENQSQKQTNAVVKKEEESDCKSFRHASLISGPLLKDQDVRHPTPLTTQLACLQVIVSLMTFLSLYKSVAKNFSSVVSMLPVQTKQVTEDLVKPNLKWWGAHQKTWNPSKN